MLLFFNVNSQGIHIRFSSQVAAPSTNANCHGQPFLPLQVCLSNVLIPCYALHERLSTPKVPSPACEAGPMCMGSGKAASHHP